MAEMTKILIKPENVEIRSHTDKPSYYFKEKLLSASNGEWVLIPNGVEMISIILAAPAGGGKIQVTNDYAAVAASTTPEDLLDWDNGAISNTTESSRVSPVYAIRQVNTSGTTTMTIFAS